MRPENETVNTLASQPENCPSKKQPWFKFFAADYLLDEKVDALPLRQRGLLTSMWAICHLEGSCPADPAELARKTRIPISDVSECVPQCVSFFEARDGRLYSHRMEDEKRKSAAARASANHRWPQSTSGDRNANCNANCSADRNAQSQVQDKKESESMVANAPDHQAPAIAEKQKRERKKFTPPSLADVQEYCRQNDINIDVQKFFKYYQVSNWHKSDGTPVTYWKQCLVSWQQRDAANHAAPSSSASTPSPSRNLSELLEKAQRKLAASGFTKNLIVELDAIKAAMKSRVTPAEWERWISPLCGGIGNTDTLIAFAPSEAHADHVINEYVMMLGELAAPAFQAVNVRGL